MKTQRNWVASGDCDVREIEKDAPIRSHTTTNPPTHFGAVPDEALLQAATKRTATTHQTIRAIP
jgi:hypothetical protein